MAVSFIVAFRCHLSDAEGGSCCTIWLSWMTGFTRHGWLHLCLAWNNRALLERWHYSVHCTLWFSDQVVTLSLCCLQMFITDSANTLLVTINQCFAYVFNGLNVILFSYTMCRCVNVHDCIVYINDIHSHICTHIHLQTRAGTAYTQTHPCSNVHLMIRVCTRFE